MVTISMDGGGEVDVVLENKPKVGVCAACFVICCEEGGLGGKAGAPEEGWDAGTVGMDGRGV